MVRIRVGVGGPSGGCGLVRWGKGREGMRGRMDVAAETERKNLRWRGIRKKTGGRKGHSLLMGPSQSKSRTRADN